MIKTQKLRPLCAAAALSSLCLLAACGSQPRYDRVAEAPGRSETARESHGTVRDIRVIPVAARTSGGGAVLGAVLGAVIGNQFGGGTGRALATGAGAVAGGVIGNNIEGRNKRDDEVFRVTVRFDNGVTEDFDFHRVDDLRVGDRVKLEGGQIHRI
jgi:uncharacterized protein YcfJ